MLKKWKSNPKYGYVIVILLGLGILMPNFAQYQVSSLAGEIREMMGLTQSNYSTIATAPLIAGIIFGFLSGMLMDRFGLKVISVAVIVSGCGVILRMFANSFATLFLSMVMMGFAATFVNSNTPKVMGEWFPRERVTQFTGFVFAFSNIALALGTGTAAQFKTVNGAFRFSGVVAIVILVLWCVFITEKKGDSGVKKVSESVPLKESLKAAVKCKGVWLCSAYITGFIVGISGVCFFLPQALASRGMSAQSAGWYSMCVTLGNMVSSFVSPILIRKFGTTKKRVRWMIAGVSVTAGLLEAFAWKASGALLVILLALAGFCAVSFQAFFTTLPSSLHAIGQRYAGAGTGLPLTVQLIFSVVMPSYVIAPIAGDNYNLLFCLLGIIGIIPALIAKFAPLDDMFSKES